MWENEIDAVAIEINDMIVNNTEIIILRLQL